MCPKIFNQKSYTEVQIRLSLHTYMQILSPSAIKLWPGHRLRRKNNINNNNKGSKISTGPLYYSIVGTVKILHRIAVHGLLILAQNIAQMSCEIRLFILTSSVKSDSIVLTCYELIDSTCEIY